MQNADLTQLRVFSSSIQIGSFLLASHRIVKFVALFETKAWHSFNSVSCVMGQTDDTRKFKSNLEIEYGTHKTI
jgi:hypothetical protein